MKIVEVETFPLQMPLQSGEIYWGNQMWGYNKPKSRTAGGFLADEERLDYPYFWRSRASYSKTIDTVLVKITADNGLAGWGEAKAPVAPTVTAALINELMRSLLIGQDPTDPVLQWERLYGSMRIRGNREGFWMQAISGVDIALWDLTARWLGIPLCKLLGGNFRNRIKVYYSGIPGVRSGASEEAWENLARVSQGVKTSGFKAAKIGIGLGIQGDIRTVKTIREVVGKDFTLYVDAAGMYNLSEAIELGRALEGFNVSWFEAPLAHEEFENYGRLNRALNIPIATDQIFNRWQVRDFLLQGGVDIFQPDLCRSGGITECKRIAELADAFGKAVTPHVSVGTAVQFAASVHFAAAMPNQTAMEYWAGSNPFTMIQKNAFKVEQGYFWVPEGPGLGIEINEELLKNYVVA